MTSWMRAAIEESTVIRLYYTPVTEPANIASSVPEEQEPDAISEHYDARPRPLSAWREMQIPIIGAAVAGIIHALGATMQYEFLGRQHIERVHAAGQRIVYAFWHRTIFSAAYNWRHQGVVVLHSANFDGRWTGRAVERLGYGTAQGSSSRGGLKGLADMARRMEEGHDTAFTIDGPRGPRYVAKPGPVMLARRTGHPIIVFHAGLQRAYTFEKSWDQLQVPAPFSRGVITVAPPIRVPGDANQELVLQKHQEMQAALELVRDVAEAWFRTPLEERERLRREWNA